MKSVTKKFKRVVEEIFQPHVETVSARAMTGEGEFNLYADIQIQQYGNVVFKSEAEEMRREGFAMCGVMAHSDSDYVRVWFTPVGIQ